MRQRSAALRSLHGVHYARAKLDQALEVAQTCLTSAERDAQSDGVRLARRLVGQSGRQGARAWTLRAATSLAQLHLQQGHTVQARAVMDACNPAA